MVNGINMRESDREGRIGNAVVSCLKFHFLIVFLEDWDKSASQPILAGL